MLISIAVQELYKFLGFLCFSIASLDDFAVRLFELLPDFWHITESYFLGKSASAILFSRAVNSLDQRNTPATLVTVADGNPVLLNSTDEIFKNQSVAREVSNRRRCCVLHVV